MCNMSLRLSTGCCARQSRLTLRPRGLYPTRLLCPWNFPDKNTGGDHHFLLQGSSQSRDRTRVSCIGRQILYHTAPPGKPRVQPHHSKLKEKRTFLAVQLVRPANAGHVGSIPDPGRCHKLLSNQIHATQLPSPCSRAHTATTDAHVPQSPPQTEKPPQCEAREQKEEQQLPLASTRESLCTATKTQHSQK